ncbi:hypothetical protein [Streptomyces sp. NPDC127040]|uniref:hypothetical protein n=1 Tax=Streptomyces sp. NPDC127040 TaxID=3347116 RepID=UPI00365D9087
MTSTAHYQRRLVTCASCGQTGPHHGHGYCTTCYSRWHYHGRPTDGPPAPGTLPRQTKPRPLPTHCHRGHPLDDTNLRYDSRGVRLCNSCRLDVERAYRQRRFAQQHPGHDVIPAVDGRRYCRTCRNTDNVDEMAVERAASGDPPARLTPAERAAAVLQLTGKGLTNEVIAQRIRCHPRTVSAARQRNRAKTAPRPV